MAFKDEINIHLKAGKGGNGVVRWRHEKFREKAGPSGGNGGRGGDVVVKAIRDIYRLNHYAQFTELSAKNGQDGMKDSCTGAKGEDLEIFLPVGSVIMNKDTGDSWELLKEGQEEVILKGGKGGLGNEHFKSSRNVTPKEQTDGKPGEEADFYVELKLIADIGLVGSPNAGKSTLLNSLTGAKSKVGNYRFTTLEPHLGDLYGMIVADIPGLIEGASEGKGLGHSFLRHVSRTGFLVFCIPADSDDVVSEYEAIDKELYLYDKKMTEKPRMALITKSDLVDEKRIDEIKKELKEKIKIRVYAVSVLEDEKIAELSRVLTQEVNEDKKLS